MTEPFVKVDQLKKYFPLGRGLLAKNKQLVKAVDGVSFEISAGETLGVVGESGCGKSTLGRLLLRLLEPTSGTVEFDGTDLTSLGAREMKQARQHVQMVFQDPYASLNPRMSVQNILLEPFRTHRLEGVDPKKRMKELIDAVGIPESYLSRYPHEFSGGQRQRIGIARALMLRPKFIIADEPVAALDVSIQAQIMNLFLDLQKEYQLTYLFIAHDLSVVQYMSDRVAVMYLGKIVELADRNALYEQPLHPYTQALISAIPIPDPTIKTERLKIEGELPSPVSPPSGCAFHPRCPLATDLCRKQAPEMKEYQSKHEVACHHVT